MSDQENLLERALRLAATDAAFIPEFYGTLLDSKVFVLGHTEFGPQDETVEVHAKAGSHLHIQDSVRPDGSSAIPFFSSLSALQRYIKEEDNYLQLEARALFEMTLGKDLILDSASEYAKVFTAFEVDDLLRHGLPALGRHEVIQEDTRVLIGQPSDYPHDITNTLSRFFAIDPRVQAAYLALMQMPGKEEMPSLCVGIECDLAHYDEICPAAGVAVSDLLSKDRPLNFCPVDPETPGALADYMLSETQPFYRAASEEPRPHKRGAPGATRVFGMRANPSPE